MKAVGKAFFFFTKRRNDNLAAHRSVILCVSEEQNNNIVWARSFCAKNEICSRNLQFISIEVQSCFTSIFSFVTVRRAVCISSDYSKRRSSWNSLGTALFSCWQRAALSSILYWSKYISQLKFSLKNWQVFARETLPAQTRFVTFFMKSHGSMKKCYFYQPTSHYSWLMKS